MPTAAPRAIGDTDVTFTPTARHAESITREAAVEALLEAGAPMVTPVEAEYGIATCRGEHCFFHEFTPAGRSVWLIEWDQRSGPAWGLVDATTGEPIVVSAVAE